MRFKSLNKGFKRSFIKSLRLAPHVFILFSIFISNIVYPAFAIAQDFDILVGEESTNETIPIDESEDILDEGISTSVFENGIYTIDKVVEGEVYVYPENENLTVKFNKVTEDGNLVIKRVLLTEEQKTSLNTKDDYGWDISSTMKNGTFSYSLTLPNTQGNDIQVKYTEDGSNYESIETSTVDNGKVVIEGLDHFTLFVIVDDGDTDFSASGWSSHPSGYNGDHKWVTKDQTDKTATWTYTGSTISNGAIYLSWTIWDDHATNATYNVLGSTVTVNQKLYADQTTSGANGTWSGWYRVSGTFNISNGSTVTLSPISGTDGNLSADAVAFVDLAQAPNEVWVDDNYTSQNNTGEHFWGYNAFNTIQSGINAVASEGTVYVASGTYTEQLTIKDKNITLEGNSLTNTIINSPDTLETKYTTSAANKPVVYINNSNSTIKNFTIDGLSKGNSNYRMHGISLYNAGGNINNVEIKNIKENPANGNQHGVGIYAIVDNETTRTINIDDVSIHDYQKNGIVFTGAGLTGNVSNSTVSGLGEINFIAQNGIQYSNGATGIADSNTVSNNYYTPSSWAATGILTVNAGDNLQIKNNEVYENGWGGIYISGAGNNLNISNNNVHDNLGEGIILTETIGSEAIIYQNNIKDNDYGIYLDDDSKVPSDIKIFENIFDNETNNAEDDGSHHFDNGVDKGNIWSDYDGFDLNGDGIGDTKPYKIDEDSSDRYPITQDLLSASITSVTTDKGYYKKGDPLTIKVTVKNTGTIPFDSTKEKLAVNLMSPSNTYVSGTFAEYQPLGESTELTFYTNPQTIPSTWAEGTYNVHTSIYSSRVPKGYLDGGQYRGTPFVIDNQKPTIEILSPDENSVHKDILNIQVKGTDTKGLGQFVVNLYKTGGSLLKSCVNQNMNGVLEGTVTCTINTNSYSDGSYYIKTNVKDLAGNMSSTLQRTFIFDNNGPLAPIIEFPTEDSYFNSTPILNNWSDVEDISDIAYYRIEYVYDDGHHFSEEPYRITTESQRYHVPADNEQGGVKFRVQAIDNAGNEGAWSDYRHYYFDKTPPEAPSLSSPLNGAVVNGRILTNEWNPVSGAVKYIYASYNDENATSPRFTDKYTTTSKSAPNVPNADIWWKVKSVDAAGNESEWSELWKVTIDNDAPTITVNDLTTNDTTPQITGTYSDPHISTITLKVNGKDYSSIIDTTTSTWSVDITDELLDGTYTLEATAVDMAENTSSSMGTLVIDTTGPSKVSGLHIISNTGADLGCEGYTNNRNIRIDWSDNTETDLDHYILDIKDKDGHKDNIIDSFYDAQIRDIDGYYTYRIRAVDKLGNIGQASDWCGVTLDRVDPIVPEISNITLNEGDTIPEIKGTVTDTYSIKSLNYNITGQLTTSGILTPSTETNSWEINVSEMIKEELETEVVDTSLIPEGTYTFTYSATDSAGNISEEKSFDIVVNNVAPSITSLVLSSSSINEGNTLTVIPTFTDPSYPSKYTPDDSPWTYSINYGDGITITGTQNTPGTFTLTHTYTQNGTYSITLTICEATDELNINSENQCNTSTQSIKVLNDSPLLSLTPLLTTVTQNSAPVVVSSSITGGNAPYTYTWTGCIDNGNQTATVNTATLGTNICTLTITDYDGDAVTANAVVVVEAPVVLGAATTSTRRTVTTTTYETLGVGGPEEDTVLSEDNTTNPEVKGVNECQDKKTISGYVYMDSNNNGEKENNEKLLKDIEIRIYTKTDNGEETIEQVKTDEEGYWETKVCEGEYFIEINTESLPNNTSLDSNVKSVSITADTTESTIDFGITDTRNFIQKYWPWLLLGVVSVGLISFLFVTNRNKKEL